MGLPWLMGWWYPWLKEKMSVKRRYRRGMHAYILRCSGNQISSVNALALSLSIQVDGAESLAANVLGASQFALPSPLRCGSGSTVKCVIERIRSLERRINNRNRSGYSNHTLLEHSILKRHWKMLETFTEMKYAKAASIQDFKTLLRS